MLLLTLPGEVVLKKPAPSAFFGTPLAAYLIGQGIDTLIDAGEAVSGCIRATVVDGCSLRLRMVVVEDCCAAGSDELHHKELEIINMIYCNVMSAAELKAIMKL